MRGKLTSFRRLVRFGMAATARFAQVAVVELVFCWSEKLVEGITHETTALPPDDAMRNVGGTVVCEVKMCPCWTTVANRPPSADEANEE